MNRIRWSVVVLAGALLLGVLAWSAWPSSATSLPCEASEVGLDDAGIARCGAPNALPAGQALTIGQKLSLNGCTVEELALVRGVGPSLAKRLVEARPFTSWAQVDAVTGVGASRLETLQQSVELGEFDAGL